jgi:hypothetical protein
MSKEAMKALPTKGRKEIFLALVEAQDDGASVVASRKEIGWRFDLSEHQVRLIEEEGLSNDWPPL